MDGATEGTQCPEAGIVTVPAPVVEAGLRVVAVAVKVMITKNVDHSSTFTTTRLIDDWEACVGLAQSQINCIEVLNH